MRESSSLPQGVMTKGRPETEVINGRKNKRSKLGTARQGPEVRFKELKEI